MKSHFFALCLLCLGLSAVSAASAAGDARVYELRVYTTNPGKFDDLLSRFRDHTVRIFERHGMRNVGYWTPVPGAEGAGNTLYYILEHASREAATAGWAAFRADPEWVRARAASEEGGAILAKSPESTFMRVTDFSPELQSGGSFRSPRVFELRRYTAAEGRLPALERFFRDRLVGLFERHHLDLVGFWEPTDAERGAGRDLVYLLAFPDRAAADLSWREFRNDPEFSASRAEAYRDGNLIVPDGIRSIFLVPVDFSPIK